MFLFINGKVYPDIWAHVVDGFFSIDPLNPSVKRPITTYQECCCGVKLRMVDKEEIEDVRRHYEIGHVLPPDAEELRKILAGLD